MLASKDGKDRPADLLVAELPIFDRDGDCPLAPTPPQACSRQN